jgi:hypothetical protein
LRLGRDGGQEARRREQQDRSISRRLGHEIRADDARGTRFVLDDDRDVETLREWRRERTRNDIVTATRRERHDDPDLLRQRGLRHRKGDYPAQDAEAAGDPEHQRSYWLLRKCNRYWDSYAAANSSRLL